MKWLELSLRAPAEYVEPLSVVFQRHGYGGVAVELAGGYNPDEGETEANDSRAILRCYLPIDRTTASRKEHIRVAVDLISRLCSLSPLEERVMEEGEWMESWKSHFSVLHMGRIVICPSWMEYTAQPGEVVVAMDPGMAFGTGHHPTTHMCLTELEKMVTPGMKVMDVGTGSGILTIAAARLGADYVLALDIDPLAIKAARANVRANGLQRVVKVQRRTLSLGDDTEGNFDLVVANLYTKVILSMAPTLMAQLVPQGHLIISGILADRVPEVERQLEAVGCTFLRMEREGDWAVLVGSKTGG
ncbi:MAG: 50S ribosomal protein L11 methyltransferase [Chloroflexi bacterium]|nr:50S ribosomal protein L11 methyltransferase [Chloroflexota bacterium]